jgi:3'(2'), 5'-bisphosphate nucleotidase
MKFDLASPEAQFALASVQQAAELIQKIQSKVIIPSLSKMDRSPVTIADFAGQAVVANLLGKAFPHDPLVGEESAQTLRTEEGKEILTQICKWLGECFPDAQEAAVCDWIDRGTAQPAERFWTLDPIDGTKGFLRGDQYAVGLSLIVNGKAEISVLGCPHLKKGKESDFHGEGSLAIAVRGSGSWVKPLKGTAEMTRLKVSDCADSKQAVLINSFECGHTDVSKMNRLINLMGIQKPPILMDSLAKYLVVAAGGADLLFRLPSDNNPNRKELIWDQAPGTLIIEEAGGRVSDLDGKDLDYSCGKTLTRNRGVLLSNGHLHEQALKALKQI